MNKKIRQRGNFTIFNKRCPSQESGAAMVEFAIVAGVFFMVIFAIVQFGIMNWQITSLDYRCADVKWEITESEINKANGDYDTLIRNHLLANLDGLDASKLSVKNADVSIERKTEVSDLDAGDKDAYSVGGLHTTVVVCTIKADIYYTIDYAIPFWESGNKNYIHRYQDSIILDSYRSVA